MTREASAAERVARKTAGLPWSVSRRSHWVS